MMKNKMKTHYAVKISDSAYYPFITAENEEEAKQKAWEWFIEREPTFEVKKISCSICHNFIQDTMDKVSACACCEDYNFFEEME